MDDLPRKLGLGDATAIVIGDVVGTAIFLVPAAVALMLPSVAGIMLVWILSGVLSFFGALAYAELGAMIPATGGQYVYMRETYGRLWGFLCGWSIALVIYSGSNAALAVGFATYFSYFVHLGPVMFKLSAVALVLGLTLVNYVGVKAGATTQKIFTSLSLAGLLIVIGSGLARHPMPRAANPSFAQAFSWSHLGVALIACLWAYEGWSAVSFVAGEVKQPQRNLPRALALGMAVVVGLYVLANLSYLRVLTISEIAHSERVATAMAARTIGPIGATLVAVTILLSTIGCTNGGTMTGPRIYFAQARDGLFFKNFGAIHPRFETPHFAIVFQGVWTALLATSGSYEKLFEYVVFVAWIYYGMTVLGVIILRRRRPDLPRPYRMWGYPVTPLLFAGIAFWFVGNTIVATPGPSLIGLAIVATGIPVYFVWNRRAPQERVIAEPEKTLV
jgi:APA family basic amino acid/polyamine antiporter